MPARRRLETSTAKKVVLIVLLPLMAHFAVVGSAFAIAPPDALRIVDVAVFRHCIETDDRYVVVTYDIDYATLPDESVTEAFILRLWDGDTELRPASPYAYGAYRGYKLGVVSFYFSATDAPLWGKALTITLEGSPRYFTSPQVASYELQATDYLSTDSLSATSTAFSTYIQTRAVMLEDLWTEAAGWNLISEGKLTSLGTEYFSTVIPGIIQMCPQLFMVVAETVTVTPKTWGKTYKEELTATLKDTPWGKAFTTVGEALEVSGDWVSGLVVLAVMLVVIAVTTMRFGSAFSVIPGLLVFIGGVLLGLVPMELLFVGAFLLFFAALYTVVLGRA